MCAVPALKVLAKGGVLAQVFNFNNLFGSVCFQIDYLSAFFILIISVMSVVSVVYSKGYLKAYIDKSLDAHLIFFPVLVASMLAVVTCQNALMFLICWEIMSLSSFFLVIFENEKKEVIKAGISYLVFMHISVIFIMLAFSIISVKSGSFDFSSFANVLTGHKSLANLVFILSFIGFGTKAGFVPFHNWLPEAHPAAPSHVSAIMSGVMIKTGIYGILRVLSFLGTPSKMIAFVVFIISIVTALYGILYAISQNDIKKLLAYSSIENIGIIGTGIGIGMIGSAYNQPLVAVLGYAGCLLHILNHAVFKELLFLAAGSVYIKTHTRDIENLGALIKSMPGTAVLFLIGSVAICALPPLNGFISEFLIYMGMFRGLLVNNFFVFIVMLFGIASLALVGTMAILCFTKVFSVVFLGLPRSEASSNVTSDNSLSMILPMGFLSVLVVLIGIFSLFAFVLVCKPVSMFISIEQYNIMPVLSLMIFITMYALLFFIVLAVLFILAVFSFNILMGNIMPLRGRTQLAVLPAFTFLLIYNFKNYAVLKFLVITACIINFSINSSINVQEQTANKVGYEQDRMTVSKIFDLIYTKYPEIYKDKYNIVFYGTLPRNNHVLKNSSDYMKVSFFTHSARTRWLLSISGLPDNIKHGNIIIWTHGLKNAPEEVKKIIKEMPVYPHSDCVYKYDNTIIVKLSEYNAKLSE